MEWKQISRWITSGVAVAALLALPTASFALTSSDFTRLTGTNASDQFGKAVASGDVNGDGFDDLVMGAPVNNTSYIAIQYGGSTLPTAATVSTTNSSVITGNGSSDEFGANVVIGDMNGDGFDDIAVSATGDSSDAGAVYVLYGQAAQLSDGAASSNSSMAKFTSPGFGFLSGASISMGDINNDGFADLLVASPNDAPSGGSVALVYGQSTKYTGTSNSLSSVPTFTGSSGSDFGNSLAAGDVNGDGFDDFLVGAPQKSTNTGSAFLFYGRTALYTGTTSSSTAAEFTGEATSDSAGNSVAMGDLNADGYADLLISAPGNDDGANAAGAVYRVSGSSTQISATTHALATTATEFTGITASDGVDKVAAIDTDGNGSAELFASSVAASSSAGAVYMLSGTASAGSLSTGTTITGATGDGFGSALAGGDLNGDGFNELLVGASSYSSNTGAVYIGALLVDGDGDGVVGSGLLSSSVTLDCSDSDATVSVTQTYYQDNDADGLGVSDTTTVICSGTAPTGYADNTSDTNDTIANNGVEIDGDGVDNDGDSEIDEHNTLGGNGVHPYYNTLAPTDGDVAEDSITAVTGAAAGVISVTYGDNSIYDYTVFTTTTTKLTLVQQYPNSAYAVALDRKGKTIKLVNLYTGEVTASKHLSKKSVDSANFLLKDLRTDHKTEAVVTLSRNKVAKLYVVKVSKNAGTLKIYDQAKVDSSKVATNKTKVKKSTITLRTSKSKTVAEFKVNKSYELIAQ